MMVRGVGWWKVAGWRSGRRSVVRDSVCMWDDGGRSRTSMKLHLNIH